MEHPQETNDFGIRSKWQGKIPNWNYPNYCFMIIANVTASRIFELELF
jgi:hypothetical protein